jgi:deferrochelatase/peroxidase EfeB
MPFPAFPSQFPLGQPGLGTNDAQAEDEFLDAVQGNILKGHGRDHQRLVFFRFPADPRQAREFCAAAARPDLEMPPEMRAPRVWAHSARLQRGQALLRRELLSYEWNLRFNPLWVMPERYTPEHFSLLGKTVSQQYFSSMLLARSGLDALGLLSEELQGLSSALDTGMADSMRGTLMQGSADPSAWREPYTLDYHGVFLVASDDENHLVHEVLPRLFAWCHRRGAKVWDRLVEEGRTWRDPGDPYGNLYHPPREPFGFVDGISMPRFFHDEREAPAVAGTPSAWAAVDLRLEDVFIAHGPLKGGSHVALLKLEQDVAGFRRYEMRIAAYLKRAGFSRDAALELAPALLMGRSRQGLPMAQLRQTMPLPAPTTTSGAQTSRMPAWLNEFNFQDARQSSACPFHAHIRKSNPRDDSRVGDMATAGRQQPVRRGMIFDPGRKLERREAAGRGPWPALGDNVGLLFLAYMANPWTQFDQWHNTWARDTRFPTDTTNAMDPVLFGHGSRWDLHGQGIPPMKSMVRRLGGAYLFAPAVRWLEDLPS